MRYYYFRRLEIVQEDFLTFYLGKFNIYSDV